MKGQVFTVAKLHYVNGVVYEVARQGVTNLQALANLSAETTKSGKVKHPLIRVRTLARLAEGVGLLEIFEKNNLRITNLGNQYASARSDEKWNISKKQQRILGRYVISDFFRTETIYSINSLFELCKKGYTGEELSHQFAIEIGKDKAWKSEVTFHGFTKFGLAYISELGLFEIDEKDLLIEDISREKKYQNNLNSIDPIQVPPGKILRPKSKKIGGKEKYSSNPRRARISLEKASFKCELNSAHSTFINKKSSKQYMEAHHIIPMSKQGLFEFDLDVPENIICLCPTCHRKIHLAQEAEKKEVLLQAYKKRKKRLPERGLIIKIEDLLKIYSIE